MRELARGLREENLDEITMSVGAGGYSAAADPKGPVAGYDPKMSANLLRRKSLGRWSRSLRKKKGENERTSLRKIRTCNRDFTGK